MWQQTGAQRWISNDKYSSYLKMFDKIGDNKAFVATIVANVATEKIWLDTTVLCREHVYVFCDIWNGNWENFNRKSIFTAFFNGDINDWSKNKITSRINILMQSEFKDFNTYFMVQNLTISSKETCKNDVT